MINKVYFNKDSLNKIKQIINSEGSIQLYDFLEENAFNKLFSDLKKTKFKKYFIPKLGSYSYSNFNSKIFSEFLTNLLRVKIKNCIIYSFKHRDYTLMSDSKFENNGFKVVFEITDNWNQEAGGYHSFIKNSEEVFRLNFIRNSLTIIKTDNKMKSFVKYVNNKAGKNKRYFVELNIY